MQTKKQLLNQVEILKLQNSLYLEEISSLRKVNADLIKGRDSQSLTTQGLSEELDMAEKSLDAYMIGATTYQAFAEAEIIRQAKEATELRLKLLNSLAAKVYGEAKKDNGV